MDLYPYYDGGCAALPCMPVNAFGNCVVPDTRIAMFPVGFKAASEVEIGDTVLSLAPNGEAAGELVAAIVHAFRHCVEVTLSNEQTLTCSLEHELMVVLGAGEPITHLKASELTGEHTLILQDGAHVPVLKVEIVGNRNVIRISLGGPNHVFFTDGVLSHNKATWPPL